MENSEIPRRIQMERFIPVEIFRKKSNTFWGITVFPFLPKRPKFSVPFDWITRFRVKRKRKIDRYFVNGTIQSRSCFRCQKNTSTIFGRNVSPKFPYKWQVLLVSGVLTRDLPLGRPALIQLSYGYNARFYLREVKFFWATLLSAED